MAYRSNNEKSRLWRNWLTQNREQLSSCVLPEIVLTDEDHWQDFLLRGYLDHHSDESNFALENLSSEEQNSLLSFLEVELTEEEKQSAVVYKLLKNKKSANNYGM